MADNLALNILIKAKDFASNVVDKFSNTVSKTSKETERLSGKLNQTNQELKLVRKELSNVSGLEKQIDSFVKIKK